ncbi:MAG: cytochrome c biogenesis protein CcdA, partial [Acidobacteriota bacterium]
MLRNLRPARGAASLPGVFLLLLPFLLPASVSAADATPRPEEIVAVSPVVSLSAVHPGGTAKLAVVGQIMDGWHVNAHHPLDEYLIPTELVVKKIPGISFGEPAYPEGKVLTFEFADAPLKVYQTRMVVVVPFSVDRSVQPGLWTLSGSLRYQPCSERICLPPAEVPFSTSLEVAALDEAISPQYPEIFEVGGGVAASAVGEAAGEDPASTETDHVGGAGLLVFGFIFLGGLGLNLTPCVFPLIPITVSFFGGQAKRSALATFGYSALYVLGMATTYSSLGVAAALTGGLFGAALQNPWVLVFVAGVMVLLALSQFGLYEFRLPGTSRLGSRKGAAGAYFMGLVVGLVAAPCIGPFVVGLLATVAREGDPLLGFWKFFVLSLGLGTPYLFLGAFSGGLAWVPRAGKWMEGVKHLFGLVLLLMAAYFLGQAAPPRAGFWLLPVACGLAALWLLLGQRTRGQPAMTGLRILLAGGLLIWGGWSVWPGRAESIPFQTYSSRALQEAVSQGRPVLIDFTARWCVPCRE